MNYADLARANIQHAEAAPTAEWKITVCFYSAVHSANHARFKTARAPADYDHSKRRQWVRANWTQEDWADYKALEDLSRIARYAPHEHPMDPEHVRDAKLYAENLLAKHVGK